MKNINKLFIAIAMTFAITSCETDADVVAEVAGTAGSIITTEYSTGKILGTPAAGTALADATINFTDTELDFDARLKLGNEAGVMKYELVKTFNGGAEITIAEGPSMPFNVVYTTIDEYLAGTGVAAASDLRIGDVFNFNVKVHRNDGSVYYYNPSMGAFSVVVNCASYLAGNYDVTVTRDDGSIYTQGIEAITEVNAGYYVTVTTGGWPAGQYTPTQGYNFNDTCNELTVPSQGLFQDRYTNVVTGIDGNTGEVLPNGDLEIIYSISFSSGTPVYTASYVKQ